ncbi:MAG TPA: hypothetical protein VF720_09065, partial [Candidatus Eisenbacteria bacterium]
MSGGGHPIAALLLALALSFTGCASRDHTNPFDPENDETDGRPDLVVAAAGDGVVELSWVLPDFHDIDTVQLVRIDDANQETVLDVEVLGPDSLATDDDVVNDRTYRYLLEFRFDGDANPQRSAEAPATPGRTVIWVLDQTRGGPLRISSDGRVVAARPGRGRPTDMSIESSTGRVASVDFINQRIETFDRTGRPLADALTIFNPQSVAIDEPGDGIWIGAANPSTIQLRSADLSTIASADTGFGDPEDIAVDPLTGALWIADSGSGRLFHRRRDGTVATIGGLSAPFSLSVDAATGDAFLADRARRTLFRVSALGDTVLWARPGFAGLYQALADPSTGGVWVSDNLAGSVTHVSGEG